MNETVILLIIFWFLIILNNRNQFKFIQKNKRKKGRKMPQELIKEFVGKVCSISLYNDLSGITGKILEVEENWMKVKHKNSVQLINGDMIMKIEILPEKYQNKDI